MRGGTVWYISLVFLLLLAVVEVWVFSMETNRRVKALRIHVFTVQELLVAAGVWYIWKRINYIFRASKALSITTVVRAAFLLLLGFAQACIIVGLVFVNQEPSYITKTSNHCLGVVIFIGTCLGIADFISFSVRRVFFRGSGAWKKGLVGVSQFTIEKLTIPIRGLNPRLNGTSIVQLSDVHLGGYNGRSAMQRIVDEVNRLDADVVVITGDLVDGAVSYMWGMVEPLRDLQSKHGVFFATGNHEYYTADVDNWIAELPKLGVTPLINSRVCLLATGHLLEVEEGGEGGRGRGGEERGGEGGRVECEGGLYLAGLEDVATRMGIYGAHTTDLEAALGSRTKGTPTVVLAHQPRAAMEAVQWSDVRLTLSGHTHAGQFFPFSVFVYFLNPLFVGLYEPRPGVYAYVSPGTLYYVVPFRHYRPELTHFTLQSA